MLAGEDRSKIREGRRSSCRLTPRSDVGVTGKGGPVSLISEPGLYPLIMRSDKPVAKKLRDWVTGTVLPAIRKRPTSEKFRLFRWGFCHFLSHWCHSGGRFREAFCALLRRQPACHGRRERLP
ncbi:hypothetical protein BLTE_27460 [Blastochloris tepida]|uniref:Bro-N domain-containing protein n=1 Tax=Blastochloris tepida TaxID=2233851 RepID=A0A348G3C8_9HYPH|nr:hypothetical protein BLTE_27460 [Blastochloris tepida]